MNYSGEHLEYDSLIIAVAHMSLEGWFILGLRAARILKNVSN